MWTFSEDRGAVDFYLLQILIGMGQCGKRKKGKPVESIIKYKPLEIQEF